MPESYSDEDTSPQPLTEAQRADLRRRLEHVRLHPGQSRPAEEALEELRAQLMQGKTCLPVEDRVTAHAGDATAMSDDELTPEQLRDLERRLDDARRNPGVGSTWEEVEAEIRLRWERDPKPGD